MALSQILPNLFLGNQYSTTICDFDVIISIGCNPKGSPAGECVKFSVIDSAESDMKNIFERASPIIHHHLADGKRVLVHCKGGINRSPMVVLAYLCRYCDFSLLDGIAHVKSIRRSVRIQPHYLRQLQDWLTDNLI